MNTSKIAAKMVLDSAGNLHDINHFMKVYAYAKTIGECEQLDSNTQAALEAALFCMTSPAHCTVKSMATPMVGIKKKAPF